MRLLLLVMSLMFVLPAQAKLMIEITQGVDNPTKMAVSPFSWSGSDILAEDVSAIIHANLERSGMFNMLAAGDMLSHPDKADDVFYRDWRALDREYLLIGRMQPQGEKIEVYYQLFDVIRQQSIMTYRLSANKTGLRDLAHKISDQVFEKITNIPGAFSTKLLYVSAKNLGKNKYNYQLYISDADGERAKRVLNSDEPILSPAWSPDAKQIAYVSFEDGKKPAIWRQDLASGKREKLTSFPGINSSPAWSPDGKSMAFTLSKDGSPDIYVMELATKKIRKVAPHDFAIDTEPQWSTDGQSIIFTSNRGGQPQIYSVDIHSNRVQRLTYQGSYNAKARVMPDGSGLIVVHKTHQGQYRIARYDLDKNRLFVLTDTYLDEAPSIAANGSMIMYATKRGEQGILAAVSIDGRIRFDLPSQGRDVREPVWSPYLN